MNNEYIWSGIIKREDRNGFTAPLLQQVDGLKIDIINAFIDVCESSRPYKNIMVQYFITELPMSWDDVNEEWIKRCMGYGDFSYKLQEGCPTCGPDYDTYFTVTNLDKRTKPHDLMEEIWNVDNIDKYLNIKLSILR